MNYFLYLIVGDNPELHQELYCSLRSLEKVTLTKDFRAVVYTDRPLRFDKNPLNLTVDIKELTSFQIEQWLSQSKFLLTLKPIVIKHFLAQHTGNAIFLDTDTFFIQDPSPLFNAISKGNFVMHLRENKIIKRKNLRDYLRNRAFKSEVGTTYTISEDSYMWNSGVIGMGNTDLEIIDEIVSLIDDMRRDLNWHTIEQFAISYFFQQRKRIIPSDRYIMHYWFFRPAKILLRYYFDQRMEDDEKAFIECAIVENKLMPNLRREQLPLIIIRLFISYGHMQDWHLYNLPSDSNVGKLLRHVIVSDIDSMWFLLKCAYRDFFNLNNIKEVAKPVFEFE